MNDTVRASEQLCHRFLSEYSFLLDVIVLIDISTIEGPPSIILRVTDSIDTGMLYIGKENIHGILFSVIHSSQASRHFPFDFLIIE
jgi:hypothetical protein